ncbi:MAG TPA: SDR family oxidoreductase [Bacillota bacterium]|nr:SDR family oxidoreductase [Bacillota bacterium]
MLSVKGKWVLVTGASRGIGKGIAIRMASYGANIILHARKKENLKEVAQEVAKYGVEYKLIEAELSVPENVTRMLSEIDDLGVQVDFVFNDAGVQVAYRKDYYETPVSDYVTSYYINTIAPAMICYHFLPKMQAKGFGRVINTTSGIMNEPEQAGYSASKAALDKITTDLGSKLTGSDVIITLADPGWCRTDLGGSQAPNSPDSAFPGMIAGAFLDDKKSGRLLHAQDYTTLSLEEAILKIQA